MRANDVVDALSCVSVGAMRLALRHPSEARKYLSYCLHRLDELSGHGLPIRDPVPPNPDLTITLPGHHTGGGMTISDLVILARATKSLRPLVIFELGTYDGLTTALFALNSHPDTRIFTLDLPPDTNANVALASDKSLVATRHLGCIPKALGINRYTQLLCDSLSFDPSPFRNLVDLALIDAAHDLEHVRNDTTKVASMMRNEGIVFWHDYGGRGTFAPLTHYLESLGKRSALYRVAETNLAWAPAGELKRAFEDSSSSVGDRQ
jgi:predicted O-methyltransferase YrrM